LIRIFSCVSPPSALTQQIPALIQLYLEVTEPLLVRLRPSTTRRVCLEVMFLIDEPADALNQVMVVHRDSSFEGAV